MTMKNELAEKKRNERGVREFRISLRRAFSIPVLAGIVGFALVVVWGMFESAADPDGDTRWGYVVLLSPVAPTVFAVLLLAFSRRPGIVREGLQRSLFVSLPVGLLYGVVVGVVFELPVFREAIVFGRDGGHSMWPEGIGNPFLAPAIGGAGFALLAGAAAVVWLLLPLVAILRPEDLGPRGRGTRDEHGRYRRALVSYVRLNVAVIDVVLLTAIAFPLEWHPWSWIGVAASVVLVVLLFRQGRIAFAKW
ncbi:hypothetical protein [Salinibacterium sp. ZJ70]|uniref:hypothetical protein n=1 Tax=Salinibacterium sp. ZJ70 TaxID=2708084 RepID=UPI001420444C|nr:hypothetical protein [Salinibacterium sp. ZJ70]